MAVRVLRSYLMAAVCVSSLGALPAPAQPFQFPTANRALLEPGGEERFLVGTVGNHFLHRRWQRQFLPNPYLEQDRARG